MIEVELPDGWIAEFPDGTTPEVMKAAIVKRFPPEKPFSALHEAAAPFAGFNEGFDALLNIGTPVANLGVRVVNKGAKALGYDAPLAEEPFKPVPFATNFNTDYEPQTALGRYGKTVGEVAGGAVVPEAGILLKISTMTPQALRKAAPIFERLAAAGPANTLKASIVPTVGAGIGVQGARDAELGPLGELAGGLLGGIASPLAYVPFARTGAGIRSGARYGNQAVRSAANPEQAAVETLADRMVGAKVDPGTVRSRISPPPSGQLQSRNFTPADIADIISRNARGEAAKKIGADHGIAASTVLDYAKTYRQNNPTPLNLIDISKELAGEGGAAPITRLGRAAYSLAGDESGDAAQRLLGRQEIQSGRVSNIVQRSVAGGDFEATRAAGLKTLQDEAHRAYRKFYAEPDLAINQLDDLMQDPLFQQANLMAQRQARIETIRRNQDASRAGRKGEPVPEVDPQNQVFTPEMLDLTQRQLRIASEGFASNPNNARHAQNLREVFLDRIEQHYPAFRDIRRNYATGMGEFGEQGALEAGAKLTTNLGAPAREALRGLGDMTPAQQNLFRLGFARRLMDMAANPQIGGAVANKFNTPAVQEIVEQLYPKSNANLWKQGQRLIKDLRREALTTRTKNDVLSGARTAELESDMGRMMEGVKTAADLASGSYWKILENLRIRLTTQLGRRGATEVLNILTETDPAKLLPFLRRLEEAAKTSAARRQNVIDARQLRGLHLGRPDAPAAVGAATASGP